MLDRRIVLVLAASLHTMLAAAIWVAVGADRWPIIIFALAVPVCVVTVAAA